MASVGVYWVFIGQVLRGDQMIRSATVKTKDFIIVIDGIFGMHTKKAAGKASDLRMLVQCLNL